ncbi:type VII secretion integral membrane protein EccD [Dactylosporangium sp. AC04546]|uniref:type VII secretion integral membrane protein EccD n=1 Tax=Dactylosporangium sp. AC04546 TaxID=2862460 RepID=UPI001EDCCEE0|nr:type VII secretion integral membrane protein EccD [Dactylosporangium sp. AC04546]WVK89094.1 type VII secretion integral membrane protein EccD [Dactylosporangium sp. AC04546]
MPSQRDVVSLARVTIHAPRRRVDVAVPDTVPVAELLPHLLPHLGEGIADDGEEHGGWALHRADGALVAGGRSFAAQHVSDGEVLYLRPRRAEWPAADFDDVVEAMAVGARAYRPTWSRAATRACGLAVAAALFTAGLAALVAAGPPWPGPARVALLVGALLLVAGVALARAAGDAVAGAVLGTTGVAYCAVAGALLLAEDLPLTRLGGPHLLVGAVALGAGGVVGLLGVHETIQAFAAAALAGALGTVAGLLALAPLDGAAVAAFVVPAAVFLVPVQPLLAVRLAKLPLPALPANAAELMQDDPAPDAGRIFAQVARADQILTGLVAGAAASALAGTVVLVARGGLAATVLAGAAAGTLLLRARAFPTVRHRVPLLLAGLGGAGLALHAATAGLGRAGWPVPVVAVLLLAGTAAAAAGLTYSVRSPTPYLGRAGDWIDGALVVSMVPVACAVAGLLGYARGFFG